MSIRPLSNTIRFLPSASLRATTTTIAIPRPRSFPRVSLSLSHRSNYRAMSTESTLSTTPAPGKHRFIVYAPDKTDEGTLARRLEVREKHLDGARVGYANGVVRLGGMMTTPEAITNPEAPKKMIGSVLIYEAESLEQVKEIVKGDIYYTAGVWDPERIIISPFFSAFPL